MQRPGRVGVDQRDGAARAADQLPHDGQPQPGTAGVPGPGVVQPGEPLEDPLPVLLGHAGAVVAHRSATSSPDHVRRQLDRRTSACRTALATRLSTARRSSSASAMIVTAGPGVHGDRHPLPPRTPPRPRPADARPSTGCGRAGGRVSASDRASSSRSSTSRTAGEVGQQVGRQAAGLAEPFGHLELGAHAGQRAAQLVRGVGHERPLPFPGRGQPVQHPVQGDRPGPGSRRRPAAPAAAPRRRRRRSARRALICSAPTRSCSTGRSVQPITRHAIAASTASSTGKVISKALRSAVRVASTSPIGTAAITLTGLRARPGGDRPDPQRLVRAEAYAVDHQRLAGQRPLQLVGPQQGGQPVGGRPSRRPPAAGRRRPGSPGRRTLGPGWAAGLSLTRAATSWALASASLSRVRLTRQGQRAVERQPADDQRERDAGQPDDHQPGPQAEPPEPVHGTSR